MTINNLEKLCIPKSAPPPPPNTHPSRLQSRRYFRAEKVTRQRLLFSHGHEETEEQPRRKVSSYRFSFLLPQGVKLQLIQAPISVTIMQNGTYFRRKICRWRTPSFIGEQHRKWSADRKWSSKWTANDPRPQVIPKQKIYKYISKIIAVEQQCSVLLTCWLTYCSSIF